MTKKIIFFGAPILFFAVFLFAVEVDRASACDDFFACNYDGTSVADCDYSCMSVPPPQPTPPGGGDNCPAGMCRFGICAGGESSSRDPFSYCATSGYVCCEQNVSGGAAPNNSPCNVNSDCQSGCCDFGYCAIASVCGGAPPPPPAPAGPAGGTIITGAGQFDPQHLSPTGLPNWVATRVLYPIAGVAGSIGVACLLYGAFLLITSTGQPQRIAKGKSMLVGAVVGIVVAALAFGANVIIESFVG